MSQLVLPSQPDLSAQDGDARREPSLFMLDFVGGIASVASYIQELPRSSED